MENSARSEKLDLMLGLAILLACLFVLLSPFLAYELKEYTHAEKVDSCKNQGWASREPSRLFSSVVDFCEQHVSDHEATARLSNWWIVQKIKETPLLIIKDKKERTMIGAFKGVLVLLDNLPSWYIESLDGVEIAFGVIKKDDIFPDLHDNYVKYSVKSNAPSIKDIHHKQSGDKSIIKDKTISGPAK